MTTMTHSTPRTESSTDVIESAGGATWIGKLIRAVLLLAVVVAAVGGLWRLTGLGPGPGKSDITMFTVAPRNFAVVLKEKGELKAAHSASVMSQVEGRATIISLVPEGTAVKKGDLLVELASDEIEDRIQQEELKEANAITAYDAAKTELEIQRDQNDSDIRKANLKIELTQLEYDKYEKADWSQQQKDAEIAIDEAQIVLQRAKEDYESSIELRKRKFITKTAFEQDKFDYTKAKWDLEKAEHAKQVLEQYTHVAAGRQRQSDVEEAQKEFERVKKNAEAEEAKKVADVEGRKKELKLIQDNLAKLRRQKENCRIYAPTQGFVVYYTGHSRFFSSDDQIREGASVHERQVLLELPDTSEMLVTVRVHEAKTDKLAIGQRANVTIEGIPNRVFTGTVSKIAVLADTQNRWLNPDLKEYETEIKLDHTDVPLKPGVTAFAEILVEDVNAKAAVPVQAVYTKGMQRFVFTDNPKQPFRRVKLGSVGTEWAQITDGLDVGDRIMLAFGDQQKRLIPDVRESPEQEFSQAMRGAPGQGGPGQSGRGGGLAEHRGGRRRGNRGPGGNHPGGKAPNGQAQRDGRRPDAGGAKGKSADKAAAPATTRTDS